MAYRIILILLFSLYQYCFAQNLTVGGTTTVSSIVTTVTGGVTLLIDEEFEGPGYQLTWNETDTNSIIDDQNTTTVPTGGGTYSLFVDGSSNTGELTTYTYTDYGSDIGATHYARAYIRMDTTPTNDEGAIDITNSTTHQSERAYWVRLMQINGTYYIRMVPYQGTYQQTEITPNTWYRVEWYYDTNAGTIDWKIDGVSQTQATGGTTGRTSRYIHIFTSELANMRFDRIAFSTEGWIGTQ